jgi:hypothetical protein
MAIRKEHAEYPETATISLGKKEKDLKTIK